MRLRALFAFVFLAGVCDASLAQEVTPDPSLELGARYWWSRGKLEWSHNAQGAAPTLGNPTSVLTYDRLDAHTLEFHWRKRLGQDWFIGGNAGYGVISRGQLDDSDFAAGQRVTSDTTSSLSGEGKLSYITFDGGRDVWRSPAGSVIGLFAGVQIWNEELEARGASPVPPAGGANIGPGTAVIGNRSEWTSLRLGVAARMPIAEKTRIVGQFAFVPYTHVKNRDSHFLRTASNDLGPTPNIVSDATGNGIQLDAEVRYALTSKLEAGAGLRYWRLKADGDIRFGNIGTVPLNEIELRRVGATLSLTWRW
jgi:hypothetical protein